MKPFDLELAKAGHPVCTRDGRDVRILCFDRKDDLYPIVGLVSDKLGENLRSYTPDGLYNRSGESNADLFMKPIKKEGWINISNLGCNYCDGIYTSEQAAKDDGRKTAGYITTLKIEWEE